MGGAVTMGPRDGWCQGTLIDQGTSCLARTALPGSTGLAPAATVVSLPAQQDWASADGLEIVLTPIQLAAIFENESIEASDSLSNRLWGGATLVGGALELVGAGALLLVPEPTAITKVAGGALGVHGLDTASTGIRQIVSGRTQTTLTAQSVTAAAEALGAEPESAANIGTAIDIVVPLAAGFAGAIRVLAIRRGVISLASEELAGGHTIARHVGRTEAQLRARLAAQPAISGASTFRTLGDAERLVGEALRLNKSVIKQWAKSASAGQAKTLTYDAGRIAGDVILRDSGHLQSTTKLVVVLRKVQQNDRIYFVLTSYPKL